MGTQFRVAVGAVGGQPVVVEASTNLVDWTPILSNTAAISPCHFHDSARTNFTQRFYRARVGEWRQGCWGRTVRPFHLACQLSCRATRLHKDSAQGPI